MKIIKKMTLAKFIALIFTCCLCSVSTAQKIAGGVFHSLAVCNNGTVMSWGYDSNGQLGDGGTNTDKSFPVSVVGLTGITGVAGGYYHSLAVDNSGNVWSWGDDARGQLGDNATLTAYSTPVAVTSISGVSAVSAGWYHSIALDNTGKVWGWGYDQVYGAVGDNAALVNQPTPVAVSPAWGVNTITAISAGEYHSLALDNTGKVWAWGMGTYGQLGNGGNSVQPTPVAVTASWGSNTIIAIAAGGTHSLALDNTGKVWSWGQDNNGQLGDNAALSNQSVPVAVSVPWPGTITAISAGQSSSFAIDNTGKVWAWGFDQFYGSLGDNATLADQPTPVPVSIAWGTNTITAIASGSRHSLVIDNTGLLWGWGQDINGQIGDNMSLTNHYTPVLTGLSCTALSVQLLYFKGKYEQNTALLEWSSANEINNESFIVERSRYENNFEPVGEVKGAGNSTVEKNYSFIDKYPFPGTNYYRLKQVDYDGNFSYSKTISITTSDKRHTINIYPVPSDKELNCEFYSSENFLVDIAVTDVLGNTILRKDLKAKQGMNKEKIDIEILSPGIYFLKIYDGIKQEQMELIKQ